MPRSPSRLGLLSLAPLVLVAAFGAACRGGPHSDAAPLGENIVYGIEYGTEAMAWRDGSHRIFIAFTDEPNQTSEDKEKWSTGDFCDRNSGRGAPVVHAFWSGPTEGGEPEIEDDGSGDIIDDPFEAAKCTGGTTKVIEPDASDLVLPDMPVADALAASALVEYVSTVKRGEPEVAITLLTDAADGKGTYAAALETLLEDPPTDVDNDDIPADPEDEVPATKLDNLDPKAEFARTEGNPMRIRINLLGFLDPESGKPITLTAEESIFLTENGERRGIKVSQSRGSNALPIDICFVLDNSGSMYEEASAITDKLGAFALKLTESGVDARFGIVGVNGDVTGAHNMTDAKTFDDFLHAGPRSSRAEIFEGDDKDDLEDLAGSFDL